MQNPLAPKQVKFILESNKKWNLAHGSVRSGKTVCTLFRFMQAVNDCPDSKIFIVGHTFDSAYRNVIRLIMESEELAIFRPFCTWSGKKLYFKDKCIIVLGAKDEGAIGNFQGDTYSLVYCDEMTLYPQSIIEMIHSRLSKPWSMGFAAMNPKHPSHICKQYIDNPNYYSLHFTIDDNPFLPASYKDDLCSGQSGLFYKRNVLGLWCIAEGAVFDFFDRSIYVVDRPPASADYFIASVDYGSVNAFACLLIGVSTGHYTQTGKQLWVEKEYFWDPKKQGRQKVNSEFANDVMDFVEPYGIKQLYIDPSAESFQLELRRRGIPCVHANNDVYNGIQRLSSDFRDGKLLICKGCTNLIREVESYVWDSRKAEHGDDAPLKKDDHAVDALRYAIASHKVQEYQPYKQAGATEYLNNRFNQRSKF